MSISDTLSREDAQTLIREAQELVVFMDQLARRDLRRTTEPGQPAFEEGL